MHISSTTYNPIDLENQLRNGQYYFGIKKVANQREKEIERLHKALEESGKFYSRENIMATVGRQEKEKDWAILGGFASGMAGAGAGIATAVNTQLENQKVRNENAKRRNLAEKVASITDVAYDEVTQVRLKLISWLESSKEDDSKLQINIGTSTQDLFQCLSIRRETRNIMISQYKYDSIDGYLEVCLDKEAYVVPLPYMGILSGGSGGKIELNDSEGRKITSIKPIVLWTIESAKDKPNQQNSSDSRNAKTVSDMKDCPSYSTFARDWEHLNDCRKRLQKSEKKTKNVIKIATIIWTVVCLIGLYVVHNLIPSMGISLLICGVILWACIELLIVLVITCGISILFS